MAEMYRFKDDQGQTVLSNTLPREARSKGYEILNNSGRVIEKVPPPPTEEEIAERKRQKELERKRREQKKRQEKSTSACCANTARRTMPPGHCIASCVNVSAPSSSNSATSTVSTARSPMNGIGPRTWSDQGKRFPTHCGKNETPAC